MNKESKNNKLKDKLKNNNTINDYTGTLKNTTGKTYKTNLITFFNTIQILPEDYLELDETEIKKQIRIFVRKRIKNLSPSAYHNNIYAIKGLLEEYEIEFTNSYWKKIKKKKRLRTVSVKEYFTKSDIKLILEYADILEKAFILTALSTGLRISTLTKLQIDDLKYLDDNDKLTEITVHSSTTKNKRNHYTFLTNEATEALKLFLKEKENYLKQSYAVSPNKKPKPEDKILLFPYLTVTMRKKWHRIINKAGFNKRDRETNRYLYKFHGLKAFFKTQLMKANINEKYIDYFSEHLSNLDERYINFAESNREILEEEYRKAEPYLTIRETSEDTKEMKEQIDLLKEKNETLERQVNELIHLIQKPSHPDIEYLAISKMKVKPNGETTFIDYNPDGKQFYTVKDTKRITALKEHYEYEIKQMRKQAKEENKTQTMNFTRDLM